ncbi:MAG TPA: WecB/TagA/CpsF family glycosyltransferase [Solirubrobacteraceae bacterium]|jgi:N-acetylglucosaminyldiphosphoundecaprenol N-acetyl-beta-D-mannosaminyltransferase
MPIDRLELLGLPCHAATAESARDFAIEAVAERTPRRVLFMNASKVVEARTDPRLRAALEGADLVGADGQSIVWAGKLLGEDVPWRMAGVDYMQDVLREADRRRWRVFLLGSTDATLAAVERYCAENLPGAVIAGRHDGFFAPERDAEVADLIRASEADVLFIGMPSPRKELWLDAQYARAGVPLAIGVGGSYEVLVGNVRRAPRLWQRLGLEWFYRFLQEPRRLFRRYARTNSLFLALLAREWGRRRLRPASGS